MALLFCHNHSDQHAVVLLHHFNDAEVDKRQRPQAWSMVQSWPSIHVHTCLSGRVHFDALYDLVARFREHSAQ